ncbi:MAG: YchJ family protein [Chlamydiia bacterium]
MSKETSEQCPCHSGLRYQDCCQRWHLGGVPETPEQLMRSRYAAYALGLADYIMATTSPQHPDGKTDATLRKEQILAFSKSTQFVGLTVLSVAQHGERGEVTFRALLRQGGEDASFTERSYFERHNGQWLYVSGEILP